MFHNRHSELLNVGLELSQSYFGFYILITEWSFQVHWSLWHSWILSPLHCGRARSCSVVNWTEAKSSSQAKLLPQWWGLAVEGCKEECNNRGCNVPIRILSATIHHTKWDEVIMYVVLVNLFFCLSTVNLSYCETNQPNFVHSWVYFQGPLLVAGIHIFWKHIL